MKYRYDIKYFIYLKGDIGIVFHLILGGLQRWGGVGSSSSASSLELQTRPKAPQQGLPYFYEGPIERE